MLAEFNGVESELAGQSPDAGARGAVVFGGTLEALSPSDIERVALGLAQPVFADDVMGRVQASEDFLHDLVAARHCIYGVTTGYGPLADNHIEPSAGAQLQRNLVYHLASGVGAPLAWAQARAIVACRLEALCQGLSAVSPALLEMLAGSLRAGLAPVIPEKGTVGASGDLTPLAHMALAFMGEGAWCDSDGPVSNSDAFKRMERRPLDLGPKEGLALVNGTSAMTGIAALNGARLRRLLKVACLLSLANAEIFKGHAGAWHTLVGMARGQPGQQIIHKVLDGLMADGARLTAFEPLPPKLAANNAVVKAGQALPQDPYSIRCVPQLLGACLDMLDHHDAIITREICAVTDNPLVFAGSGTLIHAGNFFGQHVAFASDSLANAAIMVGVLMERQIARLTDVAQNGDLPAFLQGNDTGLHSGFMGAQVTATALVAEMRTRALPASIQSIPTNANNQDVVTMGTIAARKTAAILEDVSRVCAIQAMCVSQAVEIITRKTGVSPFSIPTQKLQELVRGESAFLECDRPLGTEIEGLSSSLSSPTALTEIMQSSSLVHTALSQF